MAEQARLKPLRLKSLLNPVKGISVLVALKLKWLLCLVLFLPLYCFANDFVLEDLQGKNQRLTDYRGKWVLVNFWATWCSPCLSEIPELVSLHEAHKNKDLVVIGIAMESGSVRTISNFAEAHGMSYPVVRGNRQIAAQFGKLEVFPTSYLYNPAGELVSYQAGELNQQSVEVFIESVR